MNHPQSRRSFLGQVAAAAGSFAVPRLNAQQPPASQSSPVQPHQMSGARQNIVMFMPDELRADALACYGNPVVRTPNFDKLAQQGTRFKHCQTSFPICGPARCSMLTGWPSSVRGHRSQMYFLRPEEPNLFRYLRRASYDVFWFGKNDALAAQCFDDSVTRWNFSEGRPIPTGAEGSNDGGGALAGVGKSTGDRRATTDYRQLTAGIKVLERKQTDRPFCLFLPLLSPHPPYSAPDDFATMYRPSSMPALIPANLKRRPVYMQAIRQDHGLSGEPEDTFRAVRASYLGKVSYSDWLLGELMEALERTGHVNDTALLAFSDHGDYAGDYGLAEKWAGGLEECLTHVPLIGRLPGASGGHVVEGQTQLYDVMATCLELAQTEARHTHFSRSLVPQMHGAPGDLTRSAFAECGYNINEPQCFQPEGRGGGLRAAAKVPQAAKAAATRRLDLRQPELISRAACVKTNQYKFVSRPQGQSEFYVYANDPTELENRIGERSTAALQAEAEQTLLHWYLNTTGIAPWDRNERDFPTFQPPPSFS